MRLKGKVAVITGGGRGLGRCIALAMANEGAHIAVGANVKSEVDEVAQCIKGLNKKAISYVFDVTEPDSINQFAQYVAKEFGKVDILVNNAGIVGKRFYFNQYDDAVWRQVIEVNLFGTYYCTKAFAPMIMEQKKGRIINIASISGKRGSSSNAAYSTSKHGVIGLTRTVAVELGQLGFKEITCNAICPGVLNTTMLTGPGAILDEIARINHKTREEVLEGRIKDNNIQHRVLDPEEVAAMAVYLASDDARGITGQAINICGGTVFY